MMEYNNIVFTHIMQNLLGVSSISKVSRPPKRSTSNLLGICQHDSLAATSSINDIHTGISIRTRDGCQPVQ